MCRLRTIRRWVQAIEKAMIRLTEEAPSEEELNFFDDKESKLECNFGEAICNSHLDSTVNCIGGLAESR